MPKKAIDLVWNCYGRLTVSERVSNKDRQVCYSCICTCWKTSIVKANSLRVGNTKSCGCLRKEVSSDVNKTHGESRTLLYTCRNWMISRCYNEKNPMYKHYGWRGIKVEKERRTFDVFKRDMEESFHNHIGLFWIRETSLDRLDVNEGYSKYNCKWSNREEQANNKRNNCVVCIKGEQKTLKQWSTYYNIGYASVRQRIYKGMSPESALTTPAIRKRNIVI